MPAPQENIGARLALPVLALLLLLLAAIAAPAQARCKPENRVWQKSAQNTESLLSPPPQLLELHWVKALPQRYDTSDDSFTWKERSG